MFLRKTPNNAIGRIYLSIVHDYRDNDGKSKAKTVQKIGYLDEFEKNMTTRSLTLRPLLMR